MRLRCPFKGLVRFTFVPAVTIVAVVALVACGGSLTNGAKAFVPGAPVSAGSAIPKAFASGRAGQCGVGDPESVRAHGPWNRTSRIAGPRSNSDQQSGRGGR